MSATVQINGTTETLRAGSIADLLAARDIPAGGRGVAVAVNGMVIRRDAWPTTILNVGDKIEIVHARQGG